MKKIVYLHGFSSAGSTGTATNLRNHLYADYGVTVVSPDIPVSPAEAVLFIKKVIEEENPDLIIGTSMGGMYTELQHGHLRICVNPSFHMARLLTFKHLGKNVEFQNKRADGQKQFKVDKKMVAEFKEIETKLTLKNITPKTRSSSGVYLARTTRQSTARRNSRRHTATSTSASLKVSIPSPMP